MKWFIAIVCAMLMMAGYAFAEETSSDNVSAQLTQQGAEASFVETGVQVQGNHAKLKKLNAAMNAVKEDIMSKLREAQRESSWVKEVERIVVEYKKKVKNVKKNLAKIRKDIKELIKKKRQIRNAQIQEQLSDRLTDADSDLKLVQGKLASINAQKKAFDDNRKKIAQTIAKIKSELNHLQGKKPAVKPAKKAAPAKKKAPAKKDKKKDKKKGKKGAKKVAAKKAVAKKAVAKKAVAKKVAAKKVAAKKVAAKKVAAKKVAAKKVAKKGGKKGAKKNKTKKNKTKKAEPKK